MRLIDADKVYNDLIDNIDYLRNQNYGLYSSIGDTIQFVIEQQPTAYEVDKVVRQLDILRDKAVKQSVADTSIYATGMMGKAIQIVKAGGIDDK